MAESKNDRRQALELAISQIERQFGKGSVMRLGAGGPLEEIAVIPTGALSLDVALGIGGCRAAASSRSTGRSPPARPRSRCTSSPRPRTLGGIAAFIDAEHALDPIYARKLGVNIDELLISQPDTGEQALEIAETLVRSNAVDVIVDRLGRRAGAAGRARRRHGRLPAGLQARLMSQALRKLTAAIARSGAASSSSTRSARRSASCSAPRRRPRVGARSSSTPPCAWTSGARTPSRTARSRSASARR